MKRKRGCALFFLLLIVGMFVMFAFNIPYSRLSNSPLPVNRETTYLTGPLRADGGVDYCKVINQRNGKPTAPENNAVVALLPVLRIEDSGSPRVHAARQKKLLAELQLASMPDQVPLIDVESWLKQQADENDVLFSSYGEYSEVAQPWKSADYPEWSKAIHQIDRALDLVVAASDKPEYYLPLVEFVDGGTAYFGVPIDLNNFGKVIRGLRLRAMNSLCEEETEDAISDILALRKMARHLSGTIDVMQRLLGNQFESTAVDCEEILLSSDQLSPQQIANYLSEIEKTAAIHPSIKDIVELVRLDHLATLQGLHFNGTPPDSGFSNPEGQFINVVTNTADLSWAMRYMNDLFDKFDEVVDIPDNDLALNELIKYEAETQQTSAAAVQKAFAAWRLVGGPVSRGKWLGQRFAFDQFLLLNLTAAGIVRTETQRHMIRIAFYCEKWRMDHEQYPTLEQLKSIDEISDSLQLVIARGAEYQRDKNGFRISNTNAPIRNRRMVKISVDKIDRERELELELQGN